jgi:TolB-like protein
VERRLAAILAADVVGYSRLMELDEAGTLTALKAHREELIDPAIAEHRGRIVKLMGDGTLVEFASVVDAVTCAVAIQTRMAGRNDSVAEDQRIELRIGVHLGDIIVEEEDIYGEGVNITARLEGLAEPGGICLSGDAYRQVRGKVEANFEDLGEREVKNLAEPLRVYRIAIERLSSAAAPRTAGPLPLPDKPSIAVLPFANMSGDPEQEYFSDGITEDIITELSRLRWLFVISRNSSFTYRGKAVEVKRVARELGVRYVLEGSVRKSGNRIRITAQLIDAPADRHVWAQRYDRDLEDIFALQDEIGSQIVSTVNVEIGDTEQERVSRRQPENLDAWELYQRGMWHLWRLGKADRGEARNFFGKAIDLAPTFGSPYAGLAYLGCLDVIFGTTESIPQTLAESLQAGEKAVELDDRDAFARFALGRTHGNLGNRGAAIAESEKAVQLSPSFALAHYGLGYNLLWFGQAAEAIPAFDTAIRLSPHDPALWAFHTMKGWCHFNLGDHAAAEASAHKALREGPKGIFPHLCLASALAEQDRTAEARTVLEDLARINPELSVSTVYDMLPHMGADLWERMVAALRKAGLPD